MPENKWTNEWTTNVFLPLEISLSDRHECEGAEGAVHYRDRQWWLYDGPFDPFCTITYCPWCGEKLPERVFVPPPMTKEQVDKLAQDMADVAARVIAWIDSQAGK